MRTKNNRKEVNHKTLEKQLSNEDWKVRLNAVQALIAKDRKCIEQNIPALITTLKDERFIVRFRVAEALSWVNKKNDAIIQVLTEALKETNEKVRFGALLALGKMSEQTTKIIPVLIEALRVRDEVVIEGATWFLSQIGTDAVPVLIEALKDEDLTVRFHAAKALNLIGGHDSKTIPVLMEVVKLEPSSRNNKTNHMIKWAATNLEKTAAKEYEAFKEITNDLLHQIPSDVITERKIKLWSFAGKYLIEQQRYNEAEFYLKKILDLDLKETKKIPYEITIHLALILHRRNNTQAALELLKENETMEHKPFFEFCYKEKRYDDMEEYCQLASTIRTDKQKSSEFNFKKFDKIFPNWIISLIYQEKYQHIENVLAKIPNYIVTQKLWNEVIEYFRKKCNYKLLSATCEYILSNVFSSKEIYRNLITGLSFAGDIKKTKKTLQIMIKEYGLNVTAKIWKKITSSLFMDRRNKNDNIEKKLHQLVVNILKEKDLSKLVIRDALLVKQKSMWEKLEQIFKLSYLFNKKDSNVMFSIGIALNIQQKYRKAEQYLRKAMKIDNRDSNIWSNLVLALNKQKQYSKAEKVIKELISIEKDNENIWMWLGTTLYEKECYHEAEEAYMKALKVYRSRKVNTNLINEILILSNIGATFIHQEHFAKSEELLRKTLELSSGKNCSILLYNYSTALIKLNRFEEAEKIIKKAIVIRPFIPEIIRNKAYICAKKQQVEDTVFLLQLLVKLDTDSIEKILSENHFCEISDKPIFREFIRSLKKKKIST